MDKSLIINRIKLHLGIKTDSEFAEFLGVKQPAISNWRRRNTIDYELIITKCNDINANWLLTGQGEMLNHSHNEATHNINSSNNTYINSVGDNSQDKTNEKNIYNEMIITQRELIDSLKEQIIQYRKEIEYLKKKIKDCNENNGK